jgi:hypothetical protein
MENITMFALAPCTATKLHSTFLRIGCATRTKENQFRLHSNYLKVNIILIYYSIVAKIEQVAWNKSSLILKNILQVIQKLQLFAKIFETKSIYKSY